MPCGDKLLGFFFQAEDGIRDDLVTGVQTCALPISCPSWSVEPELTGLSYHARAGGDQRRDEVRDRLEAVHEASLTLGEETLEKTRAILPEDIRARRRSSHPGSINQATGRKRSSGQGCQGSTVDVRHVPGLSAQQRRSNS